MTKLVSPDNFARAESDLYFANIVNDGGFGRFFHNRAMSSIDHQIVIRQNRDTLYSAAVFDLDAGPVTITLPENAGRFMSLQIISEDHYTTNVAYAPGELSFSRDSVDTRFAAAAVRVLADPADAADLAAVHALQDRIGVSQAEAGFFEIPPWDPVSQKTVRDALITLSTTLSDTKKMFGAKYEVDPVRHLIGSAFAWGGNPEREALYLTVVPPGNDGTTVHRLTVKDVPVDGFWSITVYNRDGYLTPNPQNAYSLNNITAVKDADGAATVQFGGSDGGGRVNLLPVTEGWNYLVRLYRPRREILDGSWTFPAAEPI